MSSHACAGIAVLAAMRGVPCEGGGLLELKGNGAGVGMNGAFLTATCGVGAGTGSKVKSFVPAGLDQIVYQSRASKVISPPSQSLLFF